MMASARTLEKIMTCPRCGTAAPAGASHCSVCRASITDFTPTVVFNADVRSYGESAVTGFAGRGAVTAVGLSTIAPTAIGPNPPIPIQSASEVGDTRAPLEPGQAFGPRYHIIRLLGAGGMGAVYQAWDTELGVAVAIKVIRPEAMSDATVAADVERRFKRELLLARQVTHKNVVRIHDIGQIDGIKYITMSYVDGVDLTAAVRAEGRLAIAKVLQIARSVASGLAAAHAVGVVHRDLKPANIMLQADGTALIMDFGIARSTGDLAAPAQHASGPPLSLPRGVARADATMAGVIVGTVEYMAPEQARGEAVDQRADVYAFGLILYDLLAGRSRVHPEGSITELQARMQQAPPAVKTIAPDVPEALSRLVMRCVDPNPAARFQSAADVLAELERLDDRGELIPVKRTVRMPFVLALVAGLLSLSVASWWFSRGPALPVVHDPVSVVIADIQNNTNEPAFDRTLEPTLRRALEDATFVSAYDRNRLRQTLQVQPPDKMDEEAGRVIAVKQGLGVVVSGSIDRRGNGFEVSIRAVQSVTGDVLSSVRRRASSKEQVLEVVTRLASDVRTALGDETSDSDKLFAMRSLSTTSLEVVSHYAAAMESQSRGRIEEARQSLVKATELDPKFGLGYQGLAVLSRNVGRLQDSDKYIKEALSYLEGMTERERYVTRGFYVRLTGDYLQCVKVFGDMTARFSGDAIAYNQLALCHSKLRNLPQAVEDLRQALRILPNSVLFRGNLAIDAAYGSDFQTAEQEANAMRPPSDLATLAIGFSQLGQGRLQEATETYQKLASVSARGKSWSASGLADLALYEARFAEGARLYEQAAAAELDATPRNPDKAARKLTSVAYAHLSAGRAAQAVAAAERALKHSEVAEVRFLAGRIFAEAGELGRARQLAASFASELAAEPRAYGKIIEGVTALKDGDSHLAVKVLLEANAVLDTWLGHFDLGRAYLQAGAFVQADSEFDNCIKRRGEAMALLMDEEPTFGYFPTVHYYQGLVREQLKNAGFADSYRAYLSIRDKSTEDPLLPEVRKRVG
jgi:eukaryotic-like serine/threonine-protein kinase